MVQSRQRKLVIKAVGDLMGGDQYLCFGFGTRSRFPEGLRDSFLSPETRQLISGADILFGNLESAIDEDDFSKLAFRKNVMTAHSSFMRDLASCGFHVLSVANNHILERGSPGLLLLRNTAAQSGLTLTGFSQDETVVIRHERKIRFLAYSAIPDRKNTSQIRLWNSGSLDEIKKARNECDVLIISMHWGQEFMAAPSPQQIATGRAIIDAGGDLVLGHHPHLLQPIERYKHGIILYSLGNFITDYYLPETLDSCVAEVSIDMDTRVLELTLTPVVITPETYRLRPVTEVDRARILRVLNAEIGTPDREEYNREVALKRSWYRKESLKYLARNFLRYRDKMGLIRWTLGRVWHVTRTKNREKKDPNTVYG